MRKLQIAAIVVAAGAAIMPFPRPFIERVYSRGLYSVIQPRLTGFSNQLAFPLFDVALAAAIVGLLWMWISRLRSIRRTGPIANLSALLLNTLATAAFAYLWFLVTWGLNYQRQPIRESLDFQEDRISIEALRDLAGRDVDALNHLHDAAHSAGWLELPDIAPTLMVPFDRTQHDLAMAWRTVPGRPKKSALDLYFRRVSVDGMTDPFFLETLANQTLLPFERPFVVAHEWGHLAGYADESEANFLAWLICLRGNEREQYSAWISLYGTFVSSLAPRDRAAIAGRLDSGPRADLRAMTDRINQQVNPRASRMGYAAYDRFLKANRVEAGVRSYNEVIRLILGTRFNSDGSPVLR